MAVVAVAEVVEAEVAQQMWQKLVSAENARKQTLMVSI